MSKLNNAVSQIVFRLNDINYVGSGFYHYDTIGDLSKGYFTTAAHCVMTIANNQYIKTTEAYIQNPILNKWMPVNINQIYIDGVADVALIQTDIDFTNYPDYCLKIYDGVVLSGDPCYLIGNPGNYDEDSFSSGCVRDANYTDSSGYQITNSIYIQAPGIGGNSGGPIVNIDGDVIGIFTFGTTGQECFGGGSNHQVLRNTFPVLKQQIHNKTKLYLGLDWFTPSPFLIKQYYNTSTFGTDGLYIINVSDNSPFHGVIQNSDLALSCQILNGPASGTEILFGRNQNQLTPGALIYYPVGTVIAIKYISASNDVLTSNVTLNKIYDDVSPLLDSYLQTGLSNKTNASTLSVNMIKFEDGFNKLH